MHPDAVDTILTLVPSSVIYASGFLVVLFLVAAFAVCIACELPPRSKPRSVTQAELDAWERFRNTDGL